jgi:hypothetical protein
VLLLFGDRAVEDAVDEAAIVIIGVLSSCETLAMKLRPHGLEIRERHSHVVESRGELCNLIRTGDRNMRAEITLGKALGRADHHGERFDLALRHEIDDDRGDEMAMMAQTK